MYLGENPFGGSLVPHCLVSSVVQDAVHSVHGVNGENMVASPSDPKTTQECAALCSAAREVKARNLNYVCEEYKIIIAKHLAHTSKTCAVGDSSDGSAAFCRASTGVSLSTLRSDCIALCKF